MTVDQLIEQLSNLSAAGHGTATVRLASQPHYPFEWSIDGLKLHGTRQDDIDEAKSFLFNNNYPEDNDQVREALEDAEENNEMVVYIREGSQIGSISRDIWDD